MWPFLPFKCLSYEIRGSSIWCINVYNYIWMNGSLFKHVMSPLSLLISVDLSCIKIAMPASFDFQLLKLVFYPLMLSFGVSFLLKCVSWRQHIVGLVFQSGPFLCVFLSELKPCTFTITVEICVQV